jgi:hypothetical protein
MCHVIYEQDDGQMAYGVVKFHESCTYDEFVDKYGEDRLTQAQKDNCVSCLHLASACMPFL